MGNEDRGDGLPQRARGAARVGPHLPGSPRVPLLLSAELRQRLEQAVTAERSEAAVREQDRPTGGEVTIPSIRTEIKLDQPGPVAAPDPATGPSRAATSDPGAGPSRAATSDPAAGPSRAAAPTPATPRGRAIPPKRAAQPARSPNAGPVAEDEVTEWLDTVGRSPSAASTAAGAAAPPGTGPRPGARPQPVAGSPPGAGPRSAEAEADHPGPVGWLGAGIAALVVIPALVIGSLAVVAVRHFTGSRAGSPASAAPARQQAAARGEVAAWIAQQVAPGMTVSCDQAMCAALKARGLPARDLLVLGPLSADPRHSAVVVETAAVRALFGTSLDLAWAPAVLASFGSGSASITVRVVASHGAVAYQTALAGDLAARKAAGARLLADPRISIPATARAQLAAGLVDLRLLSALTALSRHVPVRLVDFGNVGPGASAGVPFRFADLSQTSQTSQASQTDQTRSFLNGLNNSIRPARTVPVVLPGGRVVLRVEFTAPSPLAGTGSQGSR